MLDKGLAERTAIALHPVPDCALEIMKKGGVVPVGRSGIL
jgi:hypothetical protein